MSKSASRSRGPVLYHPTIFSRAARRLSKEFQVCRFARSSKMWCLLYGWWVSELEISFQKQGWWNRRTIDFAEHGKHVFHVAVIHEPDWRVLCILLKWDCSQQKQSAWWMAIWQVSHQIHGKCTLELLKLYWCLWYTGDEGFTSERRLTGKAICHLHNSFVYFAQ